MPNFPSTTPTAGQSFHQTVSAERVAAPSAGSGESFESFCLQLTEVSAGIMAKTIGKDALAFDAALVDVQKASAALELFRFWRLAKSSQ